MKKLSYSEIYSLLKSILLRHEFEKHDAEICAKIFTDNTIAGVQSHGVNRFAAFIKLVKMGYINPKAKPQKVKSFGAWEQWDGNKGPGPLNAWSITDKVIELAKNNGIGCVGLKNTNHWMRPGAFGWKAAEKGSILLCWTNTIPILPPWGAKTPTTGNNPVVIAVPRKNGPIVLDMALSLYSYGKLSTYRREGKKLPFPGGYDSNGNITDDPAKIYETKRSLPIGYWKGSGLSLLFDLVATIMAGGNSTYDLSKSEVDSGMSQIYIALDPSKSMNADSVNETVDQIIQYYKSAEPDGEKEILYPGERAKWLSEKHLIEGIEIHDEIYSKIIALKEDD